MALPRTLLLTGFEPFGGDHFNPSGSIALAMDGHRIPGGPVIRSLTLPVSGPPAWQKLSRTIRRIKPIWIIATGVSGRTEISLESTAWNEDDYRIPDNTGRQPQAVPILSRSPATLVSGLGAAALLEVQASSKIPLFPSMNPGRYVCNHLYYRLLHLTRRPSHCANGRSLFLHLPCTPEMCTGPEDTRTFYPMRDVRETVLLILHHIVREAAVEKPSCSYMHVGKAFCAGQQIDLQQ